jgi:hypothetical protein
MIALGKSSNTDLEDPKVKGFLRTGPRICLRTLMPCLIGKAMFQTRFKKNRDRPQFSLEKNNLTEKEFLNYFSYF